MLCFQVVATVAQKVAQDCTLAIRIPNLLGDSALRDCTLAIRIPSLLGDSMLRDCASAIRISDSQSLRRQHAKRLHISDSNLRSPIS